MMGTQAAPERLFYDFCLEDHVPDDHLLRCIDRFLDLGDVSSPIQSSRQSGNNVLCPRSTPSTKRLI
jgi:transposase